MSLEIQKQITNTEVLRVCKEIKTFPTLIKKDLLDW